MTQAHPDPREEGRDNRLLRILFVEDDPESTELFVSCFDTEYDILTASSAEEALEVLERERDIAMVLSDQAMPGMSGVELLSRIYARDPDTIRIIITGYIDISDTIDAVNKGHIYQFILKPWDIVQMRMILSQAAQTWNLTRENKLLQEQIVEQNQMLTRANERLQASENNLRSLSSALMTAREDEQKRIAMELHDELGQSLAALKLQIRVIQNEMTSKNNCTPEHMTAHLDRFRSDINAIIENVRRLSKNLSPVIIDDLGLDAAIENIVLNFTNVYSISCAFQPAPLDMIRSGDGQRLVYRLIQETLNNIGKHSGATSIDFSIKVNDNVLHMKIADNGRGFDVDELLRRPEDSRGIGLTAMKERVAMLGGTVAIDSAPDRGTTVVFTIPLDTELILGPDGDTSDD
jgi:signal transduction histidine kinase